MEFCPPVGGWHKCAFGVSDSFFFHLFGLVAQMVGYHGIPSVCIYSLGLSKQKMWLSSLFHSEHSYYTYYSTFSIRKGVFFFFFSFSFLFLFYFSNSDPFMKHAYFRNRLISLAIEQRVD